MMRNVKVLWGIIGVLVLIIVMIFTGILSWSDRRGQRDQPDKTTTEKELGSQRVVATVGGESITYEELSGELTATYGAELLNKMLTRRAVALEAKELDLQVSNAEVEQELVSMRQGYESEDEYYEAMKEQLGLSKEQLWHDTYDKLLLEKVAVFPYPVTDEEIDDYIKDHPDEFGKTTKFRLSQIVTKTKKEANAVLDMLNNGNDFAMIAREYSIDEFTAGQGGDMGELEEDDPFVHPNEMEAAKKLEVGEMAGPIEIGGTYAVIQLTERTETSQEDNRRLRDRLRKELALAKAKPLKDIEQQLRQKHGAVIIEDALK